MVTEKQLQKRLRKMVELAAKRLTKAASGKPEKLAEYLEDVCDVEISIGADLKYRCAKVQLAFGGPNIYFDTATGKVEGGWGFSINARVWVDDSVGEAVDDYYEDYYECCR